MNAELMDSTSLTIMTGDGLLRLNFRPSLSTAQYEQLLFVVRRDDLQTRQQLRDTLAMLANEWGVEFQAKDLQKLRSSSEEQAPGSP